MLRTIPQSAIKKLGWTTITYGIVQAIRLFTNVVLARLLAPQLFGLMVIVNTIRTGVALLSDIGINQNIVSNPKGDTPDFLDTAWTLQVIRGVFLGTVCFLLSSAAAQFFRAPELRYILPVAAMFFLFGGFFSTGHSLLQKRMEIKRLSYFEIGDATLSLVVHVVLALITPTIWALILGSAIMAAFSMLLSFQMVPGLRHRVLIHRESARELIHFGKWILFSSLIWFASMNFDRLYLAREIPLALLGVFGIARTLADTVTQVAGRGGSLLIFPMVSAMQADGADVRRRLRQSRRTLLLLAAPGLALFLSLSDLVIRLLYDHRYQEAGVLLPILLLGVWFAILSTVNESILLGLRKPATTAFANLAKLLVYIVGVPIAFHAYGIVGAVAFFSLGEVAKYATLWIIGRRQHVGFIRDDVLLTGLFLLAAVLFREVAHVIGLTGTIAELFPWVRLPGALS
ncbi:oligosaccharide flippase family protein [Sphingomonas rhizophila]|nr:oligosaccharide flippase family protein [Sphingomonas rhizophila]